MDYPTAYAAIKARAQALWTPQYPTAPLIFTNEQRPTFEDAPTCLHLSVRTGGMRTVGWGGGVGKNRQRQTGEVILRLFVPADTAVETAAGMIEFACAMFRFWQGATDLRFYTAGPTAGDETDKQGVFYELDGLANFFMDTIG